MQNKYEQTYDKVAAEMGVHFRRPTNWLSWFIQVTFCNFWWARRLLGGKWQAFMHDEGTERAMLSWHWMKQFKYNDAQTFKFEDFD